MLTDQKSDSMTDTTETVQAPARLDPAELLNQMAAQIADLRKRLDAAKIQTASPVPVPDLPIRIEKVLRGKICTIDELSREVGAPLTKVQDAIKGLRKQLVDVGTPFQSQWLWRIGDDVPARVLKDTIARLIEGRALTTAELSRITGARMPRVNGVLVELQRDPGVQIYDLGTPFRARWLILPSKARPANLPAKKKKK